MGIDGLLSLQCEKESVNEETFCNFLEQHLLPKLLPFDGINPKSVVLLDNASIHHTAKVAQLIQSMGALVHFIPPYSPDLNPIEELFSKVKGCLKENDTAIQKTEENGIIEFVLAAFDMITEDDCIGWFNHAGYI